MKNNMNRCKSWTVLTCLMVITMILSGCTGAGKPKIYHVGILSGAENFNKIAEGFKSKMTELGYIEGQNIVYDMPASTCNKAEQMNIAKKFVADEVSFNSCLSH